MATIQGTTKTLPNLDSTTSLNDDDLLFVELSNGGSRKIKWADLLLAFSGGALLVNWDDVVSIQTDDGTKIPTAKLVYAMNETLSVAVREQQCINSSRVSRKDGIEWDLDELMVLVRAGNFDKFAIGDYFVDSTTSFPIYIAGKNHYSKWQLNQAADKNHIVCCVVSTISYRYTELGVVATNAGGYAASLMPSNMATEYARLSEKTRSYCIQSRIYENNKGSWAATLRDMRLPTMMEVTGNRGCASTEYASNGVCGQLPLFMSDTFKNTIGVNQGDSFWTADPSSFNTSDFCVINHFGYSSHASSGVEEKVCPLIVLA